ncbi:MAG UNVERIFIED_CONTAM: hypothetical protein LVR18_32635 [Planctomycetaceae bacterium]|jgi:hypothetical protein
MSEAAASGRPDLHDAVLADFRTMAEEWDAYATTTVHDLTHIEGVRSVEAAIGVARVLAASGAKPANRPVIFPSGEITSRTSVPAAALPRWCQSCSNGAIMSPPWDS